MHVRYWNGTRESQVMTGVKRYEEELYHHLRTDGSLAVDRVGRSDRPVRGSTVFSWAFSYRVNGADIVHATEETLAPIGFARNPDRFVVTCHDLIPLRYPSTIQDLTTNIQWRLVPKGLGLADRVIAISEFTKDEIVKLTDVPESKIDVVYQGVDHERYRPRSTRDCRERLGLDVDQQYVLVVASSLEHKRMDLAGAAFEKLRSIRGDDVSLLKAGYGEGLEGQGVVNTGWIDEEAMPCIYNAANVFLHPSEYEGFGLPILEAMACGLPVVASNRASIPEVVGGAGRLIDPESTDSASLFAAELNEALEIGTDRDALDRSQEFSWGRTARETRAVYEQYG